MKTTKILYWVFTVLFSLMMLLSAASSVVPQPEAIKGMHGVLGYPIYFIPFVGVAKILGVIAILIPGFPRIKEWAYAGFFFDLIAAAWSLYNVPMPGPGGAWYFMAIPLALWACSYIFYHKKLALPATA